MKKYKLLFLLACFIMPLFLFGQFKSAIQLDYGQAYGFFKDGNYSPLHYKETGHSAGLRFIRRKSESKNMYQLEINPKLHKLSNDNYDFLTSTLLGGDMSLNYSRQILANHRNLELFLGVGYQLEINFVDFLGLESYSWLFRNGVNTRISGSYTFDDRHELRGTIDLPIFHILNRPPYNGIDKYIIEKFENNLPAFAISGDLESWNKYAAARTQLQYLFKISQKWQVHVGYQLDFRSVLDSTKYTQLTNQISLGINYTL